MKIAIIYWSSTGNTERMAELIEQGIRDSETGIEAVIKPVGKSLPKDIEESAAVLLGCSAMGVEEIDTSEMEPFINANIQLLKEKPIALFGSYGWGDGEWMENWEMMMIKTGAKILIDHLIVNEEPEGQSENDCIEFGREVCRYLIDEGGQASGN